MVLLGLKLNLLVKEMETSPSSSTTPKKERRVIEKNRRNHMKTLYSNLYSLLPHHISKEPLSLPDQIDEAIKYIKSLQTKLDESKEKKEKLIGRRRVNNYSTSEGNTRLKSPKMEIHEISDGVDIVLITGLESQSTFYEIIRMINEEGAEVVNASFSGIGNSIIHIGYAKIGQSVRISERLKMLVHGTGSEEVESMLQFWDFEIQSDTWDIENCHANNTYGK